MYLFRRDRKGFAKETSEDEEKEEEEKRENATLLSFSKSDNIICEMKLTKNAGYRRNSSVYFCSFDGRTFLFLTIFVSKIRPAIRTVDIFFFFNRSRP